MLLFCVLWFGVLLPIHTRGQIPLPGDRSACAGGVSCCIQNHAHSSDSPSPVRSRSCAVCYLIATLDVPPPLILFAPPPAVVELAPDRIPEQFHLPQIPSTCSERGPPVSRVV